ncbi:MAG: hypothetical protein A2V81_03230 [Candidatus Abawacabacteria bacterium RBG_16_42_10]|uniref:DUF5667 domain-containing protein n=1 Tax=Candidatus Abawacabacteria bacterium RBG_16_42_10 TaxID=1817814 RepID=A0A1F4XKG1_9BACT|nr:MAG: hypothetical protein A2V81_03230 [Candidatus Abawacabacteria bacterium RBG_16_42_10]
MKRVLSSIVVASVMMSIMIPFVSADETTEPTSTPTKTELNRPHPLLQRLKEDRWQIIKNFYHAMREKFERAYNKMSEIADRMQKKADEFETKGADTADVEQNIADAKAKLADAKALVATATEQFEAIHDAEDRKAAFAAFRATVHQIRENLHAAHRLLKDAAHGLREIHKGLVAENEQDNNENEQE